MRKQPTHNPITLRFRRWSRKAYAAFISIRQAVTIGQLTANVSERFRAKQESVHRLTLADQCLHEEKAWAESDLLNELLQTIGLTVVLIDNYTSANGQATGYGCLYIIYITSGKAEVFSRILRASALSIFIHFKH